MTNLGGRSACLASAVGEQAAAQHLLGGVGFEHRDEEATQAIHWIGSPGEVDGNSPSNYSIDVSFDSPGDEHVAAFEPAIQRRRLHTQDSFEIADRHIGDSVAPEKVERLIEQIVVSKLGWSGHELTKVAAVTKLGDMATSAPFTPHTTAPLTKRFASIAGKQMAYHEAGPADAADTIVFLHGNPTSSYLWRNIIPHLSSTARCIAPDLIGQGDSDKLDASGDDVVDHDSYTFVEHRRYLDGLLDHLELGDKVTLVIHDWGSALGFDWANRHRERVAGIAYMEAIVRSMTWDDWPDGARGIFESMRSPAGEEMILAKNLFVEAILPASILRTLDEAEMAEYRRPFANAGEDRRPTLTWPRQIPLGGEPADVAEIVSAYGTWLEASDVPKLFINADPGSILTGPQREFCRSWPNQTEATVAGSHFIQEDSPHEIGEAIVAWMRSR